ncbi:MAG: sodium:proton antiporter [Candidatus Eremiobacteraeota bacterium]|nr:sodium:proton antiporter [Candidatus Eremiobacteraeota bacterium]
MQDFETTVSIVIALLAAALLVSVVAERAGIPYVVALLVVALPIELPHIPDQFAPALLFIFLPALIFEAAWNVDATILRNRSALIAILALPGVILTAFLVAGGLALAGLMPFLPALLLGAILAATDPIAVIAVFRRFRVPEELATIVEGESLFNDGAAIVLYGVVVASVTGIQAAPTPVGIAWSAFSISAGGAAIGFVIAAIVARVLRGTAEAPLQVVGTIVATFGSYLLADRLHLSGIFAAVVVGIALRAFPRFPSREASIDVDRFWSVMAYLANALVFVLMGLRLEWNRIVHEPMLVLVTLALVTVARIVLAFVAAPLGGGRLERGWRSIIALSGMRGAVSVALVIGLPADVPLRGQLIDAVFGVVFITLVLQGLTIGPMLSHLKLSNRPA